MNLYPFQGCCTAQILWGFNEGGYRETDRVDRDTRTGDALKLKLKEKLLLAQKQQQAVVICTTNSTQKEANRVLEEVGFYRHEKGMGSKRHPTLVYLWFYPIEEFNPKDKEYWP